MDGKAVNKRVLESLIKTEVLMPCIKPCRSACRSRPGYGEAQLRRKDREAGQANLFDMMAAGREGICINRKFWAQR